MLNQRTHSKRVEYGGYTVGLQQSPQHVQRLSTSLQTVVYSLCYIVSVVVYLTGHATLTQRQTTLTLYGRIKTAEQRTIIQQYTDWYTLAVDGWAVTFGTAKRGLGGLWPRPVHSSLYQM